MIPAHPLQNSWTLWYNGKTGGLPSANETGAVEDYEKNLVSVKTIRSVEDFWILHAFTKKPSSLELGANYHFFKENVKPMWEDAANLNGGKWVIALKTKEELGRVDQLWEDLLLGAIGEYLEAANGDSKGCIVGCVLGKRRSAIKIAIWTSRRENAEENMAVGKLIRKELGLDSHTFLEYFPHTEAPTAILKA